MLDDQESAAVRQSAVECIGMMEHDTQGHFVTQVHAGTGTFIEAMTSHCTVSS
eukprot:SAG22_NODE_1757_length_3650_cov_2.473669_1_plen_53_part_00